MKKILLAVSTTALMLAFTQIESQAQTIGIAPEIGMNYSNLEGKNAPANEYKISYKVGVNVHIPLGERLFFSPGLHYSVKGYQKENNVFIYKENYGYLEIPMNLMYRKPLGVGAIFLSAGPYVAFGVAGNYTINENETAKINWGSGLLEKQPIDIGINAGLGYELPIGLYARAQYSRGFTSLSNIEDVMIQNHNFHLSLGYNLWTWMR